MIEKDEFLKICKLAKIRIEDDKSESFLGKLNNVLEWVSELDKIDVSNVKLLEEDSIVGTREAADEAIDWNHRDAVLANTKHKKFDMFSVPKVIE